VGSELEHISQQFFFGVVPEGCDGWNWYVEGFLGAQCRLGGLNGNLGRSADIRLQLTSWPDEILRQLVNVATAALCPVDLSKFNPDDNTRSDHMSAFDQP
jgi:hypothetical protein